MAEILSQGSLFQPSYKQFVLDSHNILIRHKAPRFLRSAAVRECRHAIDAATVVVQIEAAFCPAPFPVCTSPATNFVSNTFKPGIRENCWMHQERS